MLQVEILNGEAEDFRERLKDAFRKAWHLQHRHHDVQKAFSFFQIWQNEDDSTKYGFDALNCRRPNRRVQSFDRQALQVLAEVAQDDRQVDRQRFLVVQRFHQKMNRAGDVQLDKVKQRQRNALEELLSNVLRILSQEDLIENSIRSQLMKHTSDELVRD